MLLGFWRLSVMAVFSMLSQNKVFILQTFVHKCWLKIPQRFSVESIYNLENPKSVHVSHTMAQYKHS